MKITGNTILITGGTSGIGLELAAQLVELNNTVIITGRDPAGLEDARKALPKVHTIQSDVSDPKAIPVLFQEVTKQFPALNFLINNAGIMRKINLMDGSGALADISREIETNLVGPIEMIKQFLPHLKAAKSAAIVNVSSGIAFVPFPMSPIYSASKAGVHAYTQCLRMQLKNTNVKVFELAAPGAKTPLNDIFGAEEVDSRMLMEVPKLVKLTLHGIEKNTLEIRPGLSKVLKAMSRVAPQLVMNALSKPLAAMLAKDVRSGLVDSEPEAQPQPSS
jgi:uncharacterized oxidoreductase